MSKREIKLGKSIGIIAGEFEATNIKYEEVQDALVMFNGCVASLKHLGKRIPKHVEIAIEILSWVEPLFSVPKFKGG